MIRTCIAPFSAMATTSVVGKAALQAAACFSSMRFQSAAAAVETSASAFAARSTVPLPPPPSGSSLRKVRVRSNNNPDEAALKALQQKVQADLSKSCSGPAEPAEKRPLSALQKRMLKMKDKLVFSLSPNAVYRIKKLLEIHNKQQQQAAVAAGSSSSNNPAVGIRVGVHKRGCSGYSYTVNYALQADLDAVLEKRRQYEEKYKDSVVPMDVLDSHVEQSGVHVIVDGGALFYVVGTRMDYETTDVEEKFIFANPNKKSTCGCGDSFMPEM